MFEWLRTLEPEAPDGSACEASLAHNQVPAEIASELAHEQEGRAEAATIANDRRMQQQLELRQLITQGRYFEAAELVLEADPPSAIWHCSTAKRPLSPSPERVHVYATNNSGSTADNAAADTLHPAGAPEQLKQWQVFCAKLQAWSVKALQQACPDSSMSALQQQQLRQAAAHHGPYKMSHTWWRLYPPSSSTQACQLAAVVFHLSSSREQAWTSISQALWHGLALELTTSGTRSPLSIKSRSILKRDAAVTAVQHDHSSRQRQSFDTGSPRSSSQHPQHYWSPHGAVKRLSELQGKQSNRVKDILATLPTSATLGVEMAEAGQALLPTTYLQLVGQKLLGQAAVAMPVLLSLPETPPDWLLRSMFTKPFAEALRLALTDILNDPNGDASPYVPHLQQQAHSRDFRRIYPSEASCTAPAAATGSHGALGVDSLVQHAGNRALLGVLACVFRDVQEFEAGLLILSPDQAGSSTDTYVHNSNVNSLTSSAAVVPRLSNTDSRAASGQSSTTLVTAAQHGKASGSGLCKTLLAPLLSKDLQEALAGCKRQLGELMAENSKQMMLMTLEEELQGPLHELLLSACEVKADTWPQVAAAQCAAAVSPTVPPGKFDSAISSAAEAASTSAEPTGATAKSAQPVDDSSTDTNSSRYSIFGGGSLWQVDPLGSWELATTAGRGPGFSRAHRMPSISDNHRRGVVEGTTGSSVEGVRHPDQQHRGSVYHSSPSFSMQSYTRSSTAGQGGGLRIGRRTTSMTGAAMLQRQQQWKEEYLHQPQQVTQSQAQLLMFVGAFLARRQQYPLMLQDILVTALIEALAAAMQHVADLFDTNSDNQAALKEEPTAYHCCCISMVLCINRRLLWLKEERTPQHERVLQLLDDSIQQSCTIATDLKRSLVDQMTATFDEAVLPSLQAQPWISHKPPLSSKRHSGSGGNNAATVPATAAASPAVRLWHLLMQTWQYTMRRVLPAATAVGLLSQVLQHSCRALSELYTTLQLSKAWLPTYQQDIAVIVTTAWEFSQPLQVVIPPMQQPQAGTGHARASNTGGMFGMRRALQGQLQALNVAGGLGQSGSGTAGSPYGGRAGLQRASGVQVVLEDHGEGRDTLQHNWPTEAVSLPEQLAAEVSHMCKQLVLTSAKLAAIAASAAPGALSSSVSDAQQQGRSATSANAAPPSHAAEGSGSSSGTDVWGWLSAELQLVLESRVLGQNLPARRLLDVVSHAAIGTDLDDVSADVWLQQGKVLLAQHLGAA